MTKKVFEMIAEKRKKNLRLEKGVEKLRRVSCVACMMRPFNK